MSTRYTNAVVNKTFEPPHTFKKEDGSEGVAVPPHVRVPFSLSLSLKKTIAPIFHPDKLQFAGIEKDEIIPREWLEKMDKWQHELESSIHWDQGDVLIIDVCGPSPPFQLTPSLPPSPKRLTKTPLRRKNRKQNYAAQHARWAWEGDRKIQASFWDQPGLAGVPIMA